MIIVFTPYKDTHNFTTCTFIHHLQDAVSLEIFGLVTLISILS